jgi:hypothetical protein
MIRWTLACMDNEDMKWGSFLPRWQWSTGNERVVNVLKMISPKSPNYNNIQEDFSLAYTSILLVPRLLVMIWWERVPSTIFLCWGTSSSSTNWSMVIQKYSSVSTIRGPYSCTQALYSWAQIYKLLEIIQQVWSKYDGVLFCSSSNLESYIFNQIPNMHFAN